MSDVEFEVDDLPAADHTTFDEKELLRKQNDALKSQVLQALGETAILKNRLGDVINDYSVRQQDLIDSKTRATEVANSRIAELERSVESLKGHNEFLETQVRESSVRRSLGSEPVQQPKRSRVDKQRDPLPFKQIIERHVLPHTAELCLDTLNRRPHHPDGTPALALLRAQTADEAVETLLGFLSGDMEPREYTACLSILFAIYEVISIKVDPAPLIEALAEWIKSLEPLPLLSEFKGQIHLDKHQCYLLTNTLYGIDVLLVSGADCTRLLGCLAESRCEALRCIALKLGTVGTLQVSNENPSLELMFGSLIENAPLHAQILPEFAADELMLEWAADEIRAYFAANLSSIETKVYAAQLVAFRLSLNPSKDMWTHAVQLLADQVHRCTTKNRLLLTKQCIEFLWAHMDAFGRENDYADSLILTSVMEIALTHSGYSDSTMRRRARDILRRLISPEDEDAWSRLFEA